MGPGHTLPNDSDSVKDSLFKLKSFCIFFFLKPAVLFVHFYNSGESCLVLVVAVVETFLSSFAEIMALLVTVTTKLSYVQFY